ncbi:MAG: hypothetical protein EXS14_08510 [Planctomycetes bacterium]|nr:hypothetical protein [Planctomycetota bacterium]
MRGYDPRAPGTPDAENPMRTVLFLMLIAFTLAACSKPAPEIKKAAPIAVTSGRDAAYKAFPKDDPKVQQLGDGLMVLDLVEGKGQAVDGICLAKLNYTGWLPTTGKVFDANWKHSTEPVEFPLAKGQLIDGFLKGFKGLKEGGKRLIYIPAAQGYGAQAAGDIPPNSDLLFEVALFQLNEAPESVKKAAAEAEAAANKPVEPVTPDTADPTKPTDPAKSPDQGK